MGKALLLSVSLLLFLSKYIVILIDLAVKKHLPAPNLE